MKVNILESHDRLLQFQKQADYIAKGCKDCIENRPREFGNITFYIFAHKRSIELDEKLSLFQDDLKESLCDISYKRKYNRMEEIPSARLIFSPRLTKPEPQENSMLFRNKPPSEDVEVLWMIPDRELFGQYKKGNLTESSIITESVHLFLNNKSKLAKTEKDDIPESTIKAIYREIAHNSKNGKSKKQLIIA